MLQAGCRLLQLFVRGLSLIASQLRCIRVSVVDIQRCSTVGKAQNVDTNDQLLPLTAQILK